MTGTVCYAFTNSAICKAPVCGSIWIAALDLNLITGFMAKESVVSTLSILFGNTAALLGSITSLSAASLLAFCLLYTPCVAAIASIKRELGGKWAIFVVLAQCVIAWLVSFAVYLVGGLFF